MSSSEGPTGCSSVLRRTPSGDCWFRDETRHDCSIHRLFGEIELPSACRHFPRIVVISDDRVAVSLSHYCPTAAAALFKEADSIRAVDFPRAFPKDRPYEGLDVRGAYSPLLRPGVILGADGLRVFERGAIRLLSESDSVWDAIARISRAVEIARTWTPADGDLADHVANAFGQGVDASSVTPEFEDPRPVLAAAVAGPPPGSARLPGGPLLEAVFGARVDAALRRYLAARLFAAWIVHQSEDLATLVAYLRLCLSTVFLFAQSRPDLTDEIERYREAVRSSDLWILHFADPEKLARNLR